MTIVPFGDQAVLINLQQEISPSVNQQAIALCKLIESQHWPGVIFCAPAYASVTVGYQPELIAFVELQEQLRDLLSKGLSREDHTESRELRIPVCYDQEYGPDLDEVARQTGLTRNEIIGMHYRATYRVYMLGFLPGFTYMGKVPDQLFTRRRERPRTKIPPGSVGLAGLQTGIYPSAAPGGWQIIGRTPVITFDHKNEDAFPVKAGDEVRFYPVTTEEYAKIEAEVVAGTFKIEHDA